MLPARPRVVGRQRRWRAATRSFRVRSERAVPYLRIPSRSDRPDVYFLDGHWNTLGHDHVADFVANEIQSRESLEALALWRRRRAIGPGATATDSRFLASSDAAPDTFRVASGKLRTARFSMNTPVAGGSADYVRHRAAHGTLWTVLGFGGEQILRFAGNVILARILTREDFALNLLVSVFLQGLQMFSDVGIRPSVVRSPRGDDPVYLDTAWTLQLIRGSIIFTIAVLGASAYADFYETELLAVLVPVAAVTALIDGLEATKLATANRHLHLERVVMIRLGSAVAGLLVTVAYGVTFQSVWCFVVGALTTSFVRSFLSFTAVTGRGNRLRWESSSVSEITRFGRWIFLSTALTFIASSGDLVIFGKLLTKDELGVYAVAVRIAMMPRAGLAQLIHNVIFPLYSRTFSSDDKKQHQEMARVRRFVLLVAGWMIAGLLAVGDAFVRLVYPDIFHDAGWILQILAIGVWMGLIENLAGAWLLAIGQPRWFAIGSGVKAAALPLLIPLGFYESGLVGAIIALVAAEAVRYAVVAVPVALKGGRFWLEDIALTIRVFGTGAAGAWLGMELSRAGTHDAVVVSIVGLAVTLVWIPPLAPLLRFVARRR